MAVRHFSRLGALLKHYRVAAGLTQEELAERAEVSVRSISDLERGRQRTPYRDTVRRLGDALELPAQDRAEFEAAARTLSGPGPEATSAEAPLPTGKYLGALPGDPLVGEAEELERIQFALDAVEQGSSQLVLLAGEPGIGKTRLAQEVVLRVRERGFLTATGRCYQEDQMVPLYPFGEIMDMVRAAAPPSIRMRASKQWPLLDRLLTDGTVPSLEEAVRDRAGRLQLFEQLAAFLAAVAREQRLALVLDDLQWADEASLDLLRHLTRRSRGHRMLLLATCRSPDVGDEHDAGQVIRDLIREGLVERVSLRRLTREGTAELVASRIANLEEAEEFVEFVHRRSKGNPAYVEKMIHALGGRYRLIRKIGAGGMGQVFEAIDTQSEERVAAKVMLARTETDLKARLRFEQEGAVLATLDHPNIVRVYGTFVEEHASYIIMELIEGHSLGQLLRSARLDLPRIKRLMLQTVAALECAHGRGVVHRDIKPDNIMVSEHDRVRVTDFGIARMLRPIDALSTMTSTGMTMGTPLYMAPEQIRGEQVDARTDVYALGCTLYQLVTGQPPFQGDDPLNVALQHVLETPRPPREINDEVPEDWEALILRMLAKDPAQRVATAAALSRQISALSDGVVERPGANRRLRLPLVGVAAAVACLAVSAAVVVSGSGASSAITTVGRVVPHWGTTGLDARPLRSPSGIAVGAHGHVYVADRRNNRIVVLSPTGLRLAQWGTPGSGPGQLDQPRGVAVDKQGDVYVADTGNHRVQEFSPGGRWLRQWFGPMGLGRNFDPLGLACDGLGNIYVADAAEGEHPSQLVKLSPRGAARVEHWDVGDPAGVTVDGHGAVYVADTAGSAIRKLSGSGKLLATWHSGLQNPAGVTLDRQGNVYVADTGARHIRKLSPAGRVLAVWGRGGSGLGELQTPGALAVDGRCNVFVADTGNNRTVKLSPAGVESSEWDSQPSAPVVSLKLRSMTVDAHDNVWVADDQGRIYELAPSGRPLLDWEPPNSRITAITDMAVDRGGSVSVSYMNDNRIVRFSSRGHFLTQWGSSGTDPGGFDNPAGVAVDRQGNVYVADTNNDRVQKFSSMGQTLQQWGTRGSAPGQFDGPVALIVDRRGDVWVVDNGNNRIEELSSAGKPLSIWGKAGSGPGQFQSPSSLAVDVEGDVYVADTGNHRIQKFSPDGRLLAESGVKGFDPGEFVAPTQVAVDSHGNVYVLDMRGLKKVVAAR